MTDQQKSFVRFEVRPMEDRQESLAKGHYVAKNVEFIIITPPGGSLVVEREVTQDDKQRYGRQYDAWKNGLEIPPDGTWIKNWAAISPAEAENLLYNNVRTIEELAGLPQQALQKIGMGAVALQKRAKAWVESAKEIGQAAGKIEALEAEKESLLDVINGLQRQVAELSSGVENDPVDNSTKRSRRSRNKTA